MRSGEEKRGEEEKWRKIVACNGAKLEVWIIGGARRNKENSSQKRKTALEGEIAVFSSKSVYSLWGQNRECVDDPDTWHAIRGSSVGYHPTFYRYSKLNIPVSPEIAHYKWGNRYGNYEMVLHWKHPLYWHISGRAEKAVSHTKLLHLCSQVVCWRHIDWLHSTSLEPYCNSTTYTYSTSIPRRKVWDFFVLQLCTAVLIL